MLIKLHAQKGTQLVFALLGGICFGFLLQRGGVTRYDVFMGQLLLTDFTVFKIMLTAVITGMVGVHLLRSLGLAQLHPKPGSLGSSVIGGLIFGVGFAIVGYCPCTVAGAVGQGSWDALFGGVVGMHLGAGFLAASYPRLARGILRWGDFGELTLPQWLKVNPWVVVVPVVMVLTAVLVGIEKAGW